jgi:NAD(P)-dependent dehydrogenase (short-subunit alcohol dehydrogenase family)
LSVACITGFNRGIGRQIAILLARAGFHVVGVCRSSENGQRASSEIRSAAPGADADYLVADLSERRQIDDLASQCASRFGKLDLLVNNAGLASRDKRVTPEGLELTFFVDCAAAFLLSRLLMDQLRAGSSSRIVNVTSGSHRRGKLDYGLFSGRGPYNWWKAYASAKLALTAASAEMARRLGDSGVGVYAVHPGLVPSSDFGRGLPPLPRAFFRLAARLPSAKTVEQGAEAPVYAATSEDLEGKSGVYLNERSVEPLPAGAAQESARRELWHFLCRKTGMPEAME